jgi:hypothetical protein
MSFYFFSDQKMSDSQIPVDQKDVDRKGVDQSGVDVKSVERVTRMLNRWSGIRGPLRSDVERNSGIEIFTARPRLDLVETQVSILLTFYEQIFGKDS